MKITWLGHSGFRIEIAGQILLVDPWLEGNPVFPAARRAEAINGATQILLTHGHGDHIGDTIDIARTSGVRIACLNELAEYLAMTKKVETMPFGKGGTIALGDVRVTLVNAVHSNSLDLPDDMPVHVGSEAGFMIAGEGHTIYVSGDTDIMADMDWMGDYHKPDIGIMCAGGHYTMDMARVAYAAKRYFNFKTLIPCHYKTFPILAQSAQPLIDALPGVNVLTPDVMAPIAF
jgi:L-ascorbate metabolism protein UlaG (beta-lactamase superfamily)